MSKKISFIILSVFMLAVSGCDKPENQPVSPAFIERITVATMNVDGLPLTVNIGRIARLIKDLVPPEFIDVDTETLLVNPDGPGNEGSRLISEKIRQKGWDVFGLNEDFNYHKEVWNALESYCRGTYQGPIDSVRILEIFRKFLANETLFNTDGLELGVKKPYSIKLGQEVIRPWKSDAVYGYTTNSNDKLTTKGFRYYQVCFDNKTNVDFIVLHADAGPDSADIQARQVGMLQLYDYITTEITTDNPLILMGDFNCYYTRDRLKELIIDRLNSNPAFEAGDAWIECTRDGVYPDISAPAVPGEQLDKIIYVNRSNSSIRLVPDFAARVTDFTYHDGRQLSDHYPLQASFLIERLD